MVLNHAGHVAKKCWQAIPDHFPHATIDEFIIMPNHVHGIIFLNNNGGANVGANVGAKNFSPLRLGVTKWFRQNTRINRVWQRNYWEHIVRDEQELARIRQYIVNNPAKWELDCNFIGRRPNTVSESSAKYGVEPWMV